MTSLIVMGGDYDDDDEDEAEGDLDSDNVVEHENKQPGKRENARVRKQEDLTETRVLSIARDLLYNVGRRWTPKHVGLGSSLQQVKELVDMFRNVGHTISYWDVRRVDTALAKHTLSRDRNSQWTLC